MRSKCPGCGNMLLDSLGTNKAKACVLIDEPLYDDIRNGVLLSGVYGDGLKTELAKLGVSSPTLYITSLWKHGQNKECDFRWHVNATLPHLLEMKLILMLGSHSLTEFTGHTAMEVSGTIVKSVILKKQVIVAGPSISAMGKTPIGELRMALELFAEQRRKLKC